MINPRSCENRTQANRCSHLVRLTANHLSTLLNQVLNDSTYRDNARKLQEAIAKVNGLSAAADLVEDSLGVTKKVSKA